MPLSCQWQQGDSNAEVSSSSDEESNLASSVDYEQQKRKGRTHTRDRLGALRISNPDIIQQIGRDKGPESVHSNGSSRRSSGKSHRQRKGRKSLSKKSKSIS